jgi:hypothetical protein
VYGCLKCPEQRGEVSEKAKKLYAYLTYFAAARRQGMFLAVIRPLILRSAESIARQPCSAGTAFSAGVTREPRRLA